MMKPNYVRVIIDRAIQRELDYSVPETLADRIGIGSRVRVPFRDKSALATVMRSLLPQVIRRAEVGWKKQLFVQPLTKIDSDKIDNLRKRAPRQAELLEAIAKLEKPTPAAQLLHATSSDNQTLRTLAKRGLTELRE